MRILNLVIELRRGWDEREITVVPFQIHDGITSPEGAVRGAVQDFINSNTEISMRALNSASGDFNWGDVFSTIPDEYFIRRGLTPLNSDETVEIVVDHDEILDNRKESAGE